MASVKCFCCPIYIFNKKEEEEEEKKRRKKKQMKVKKKKKQNVKDKIIVRRTSM